MPLHLVLGSLLFGIAFTVTAAGRDFAVSWIDLVAYATAGVGLWKVWRTRRVRVDGALLAYLALGVVFVIQILVLPTWKDVLGGSSRFVTAAAVVFGLSQLVPTDRLTGARDVAGDAAARAAAGTRVAGTRVAGPGDEPWRWSLSFAVFGGVLAIWVVVQLLLGVADPDLSSFYDLKKNVVTPLGASNYLAVFLVATSLIALPAAWRDRRWWPAVALSGLGLAATLSRGAWAAFAGALVLGAVGMLWGRRRRGSGGPAATALLALALAVPLLLGSLAAGTVPATPNTPDSSTASATGTSTVAAPAATESATPADGGSSAGDDTTTRQDRMTLYRASWDGFLEHPVLGVGLNSFLRISGDLPQPHDNAHNLELHALATTGVLGTLPYLALWVLLAWRLLRLPASWQRTALTLAALGIFLHAQVEALAFTRAFEALVAVLLVVAGIVGDEAGVRAVGIRELVLPSPRREDGRAHAER